MIAFCIEWLFWSLVASPLNTSLCMYLCGYCTVLKGSKEMAFLALIAITCFLNGLLMYLMMLLLRSKAVESNAMFAVMCLVASGLGALTFCVYHRWPGQLHRRRTGTVSESMEELGLALARFRRENTVN